MATKLDNRPEQIYDSEEPNKAPSTPSDDYITSGIADAERHANTSDGQGSSVDSDEAGIQNKSKNSQNWKNNTGLSGKKGGQLRGKKGKALLSAFIATVIVSAGGVIFLLPGIAVKSVMAKSTEFFMDRVSYVTEKRVERLIGGYFTKMVAGPNGSIERCGTYISADCNAVDPGRGIAGNLYKNWSEARLEERLNQRYGLEFTKNTRSGQVEVWKTNSAGIRGQVGIYGENTVSREIAKLVDNETRWKQVRDRLGVRSLLAGRYGAEKWCFTACDKKDSLDQIKINALTKAKLRIAARVMTPVSAKQTAIILCLLSDCSDTETSQAMRQAAKDASGATDAEIAEAYRAISGEDPERPSASPNNPNRSITQHYLSKFLEKILTRFGVENSSRVAFSAVPLVGWIYAGVTMADLYDSLDTKIENKEISKYIREINESAYVDYFSIVQASSDEVFSGEASLEDIGAISTILSGSNKSRVYQKANGSQNLSTVECEDGVVLSEPTDPLACPEKAVQPKLFIEEWRQTDFVKSIQPIVNKYGSCIGREAFGLCPQGAPKRYIKPILNGIDWVLGGAASIAMSAIGNIPILGDFVEDAQNFIADKLGDAIKFVAEKTFRNVVDPEAENQEAFDQLAAGLDVAANSFAKGDVTETGEVIGLGGSRLTEQQEIVLAEAISDWKREKIEGQSFFARYFDVNNPESLASSTAVAISHGVSGNNPVGSVFSLNTVSSLFKNLLPFQRSYANEISNRQEVFGVEQYGYALDDPSLDIDPEELTPERCAEFERLREESAYVDTETKQKIYTLSNPCLMDEILAESLAKVFNLDPEGSRYDPNGGSSSTTLGAAGLNGYAIPCEGLQRQVVRSNDGANWEGIPDSGVIGTNSTGQEIKVYIREACDTSNPRTLVIGSSIHGSENGGQIISQELLFNTRLPADVRVIAIPEINKFGIPTSTRKNANGVDLNRNFDYRWDTLTETKNLSTSGVNYRGTAPESEPETKAVVAFLESLGRTNLFISYHDNINWVAPVGNTPLSIAQSYSSSTGMNIGNSGGQYVTQRGSMDAWYNAKTESPTLLVELTNNRANDYINSHVEAIRRLFDENVVQ